MLKYPTDDGLLTILPTNILIELDEARLAAIIDDDDALDHDIVCSVNPVTRARRRWISFLPQRS